MPELVRTGQRISHYEIGEVLGAGAMGVVYRASDLRLGRGVALKFLKPMSDPVLRERLIREARAASSLDHPNICTIFEVDETPSGEVFIAMACYEGETLDRMIGKGPIALPLALNIAMQTGRGLAAAHEELIIHRDVKPGNLMLARGDIVKVLDFGIAKLMADSRSADEGSGSVIGTPTYMSPEHLRGEPVDQRTDIWSLGVVLYEMLTGVAPFQGGTVAAVVQSVLFTCPESASARRPDLPPAVDRIISRAMAHDLRQRYERVDVMVQEMAQLLSSIDSGAVVRTPPPGKTGRSIAVLPFKDMSAAQDQDFLCDGIAEELLRALGHVPNLHVASRTSAFQFKDQGADIREIGVRLNVDTVLEGSVRRSGDRIRVSAQLIDVNDGYRLWHDQYERDLEDIFQIEDDIAEKIAGALEVTLSDRAARIPAGGATEEAQAYELYLQGRKFFHQHRRKAFQIALHSFSMAIEIDPGYARAYAGISTCHAFLYLYFGPSPESLIAADEASRRALELGPDLADAHVARGLSLFLKREFDQSEFHLRKAIELDPRLYDPHYIFGRVCFTQGRFAAAADCFRDACAIAPEAFDSWYLLGMCYRKLGEASRARSAGLECIEAVKKRVRSNPDDTRAWTMGAGVLAELGEPERATKWILRALAIDADEPIIQYNAACVYAVMGRVEESIACLEAAVGRAGISADWVRNDPDLDSVRQDPRCEAILRHSIES